MIWLVMIVTGALTFASRFVMFSDFAPKKLPAKFEDALTYVPTAVLSAIILPSVLIGGDGAMLPMMDNARLPAALIAVGAALVTRSVLATIASGMAALWLLEYFVF